MAPMSSNKRTADDAVFVNPKRPRMEEQRPKILDLDSKGDIVIIAGSPDGCKKQFLIRVNSALLIAVSPVFKAMLGPGFSEGQTIHNTTNPLALPDDDPMALLNMLRLIHYTSKDIEDDKHELWLVRLFVVCEKYGCLMSFKDFFELGLLRKYDSIMWGLGIRYAVIAASIGHINLFERFSINFFKADKELALQCCANDIGPFIPEGIFDEIETHRAKARQTNRELADYFVETMLKASHVCAGTHECIGKWMEHMRDANVYSHHPKATFYNLKTLLLGTMTGSMSWKLHEIKCRTNCGHCGDKKRISAAIGHIISKADCNKYPLHMCMKCFSEGKAASINCEGHIKSQRTLLGEFHFGDGYGELSKIEGHKYSI